jgi:multiple sugar transport system permease protein
VCSPSSSSRRSSGSSSRRRSQTTRSSWKHLDHFSHHVYRHWIVNSLVYSLTATAITLVVSIPAGYGLALGRFPGRRLILSLTLISMIIPSAALVLPIYLEMNAADHIVLFGSHVHLINSAWSVILPFAFFPFGVYLAYIYYATALPPGLLDAARVDGCGEWAVFRRVGLPLAKPIVAFVFFFSFVANYNNFFLPFVFLAGERTLPVQVGLQDMFHGSRPALALATLVAAIPVAIVYVFSQRALVRGLVSGASKG